MQGPVHPLQHWRFGAQRLDCGDAGNVLDHLSLMGGACVKLCSQAAAQEGSEGQIDQNLERKRHQDDKRQGPGKGQKDGNIDNDEKQIEEYPGRRTNQKGADRVCLADPGHGFADGPFPEMAEGQLEQMVEDPGPEFAGNPVRRQHA